jgi:Raf kinase inhibitor-like YbhB/YbcL family protein
MGRTSLALVTVLTLAAYMQPAADAHGTRLSSACPFHATEIFVAARAASSEAAMQVQSNVISPGGKFPKRETCDGQDTSPQLAWSGAPPDTKTYALILDDPDAPSGTFTHWIVWNIPASAHELPENLPRKAELPDGTRQGRNDFGKIGYGGPCPPPGKPHRYFFRVYALDNAPPVKAGAGRGEVERALQGHILAQGELMGRYGR